MISDRFAVSVTTRVALITLTCILLAWLVVATSFYATMLITGVVLVAQVALLIRRVTRTNRSFLNLLESVRHANYTRTFDEAALSGSALPLRREFNELLEHVTRLAADREQHYEYIRTVFHHIGTGLVSYRADGTVDLANPSARKILRTVRLDHIDDLVTLSPDLVETLKTIRQGERRMVKVRDRDEIRQLSIEASSFVLGETHYTLVSVHDISSEMEEQELDAWQNLTRVLTHEIMNSITPISSLAGTVSELLTDVLAEHREAPDSSAMSDNIEDITNALDTIRSRSNSLLHFVDNYRRLTRLPVPNLVEVPVRDLLDNVSQLSAPSMKEHGIAYSMNVDPESLTVSADRGLIEQVLLNLVKNAVEALSGRDEGKITVRGYMDEWGRPSIEVADNGPGMSGDAAARIFIPFYTTKPEGSGIGLSLSRRVMRLHNGTITVRTAAGEGAAFTLRF